MKRILSYDLALLLISIFVGSCAAEMPYVWIGDLPAAAVTKSEGLIQPRDTIMLSVRDQASLSGEFVVHDDGRILLPSLGEISVAGRSPSDVAAGLQTYMTALIVRPVVTVSITHVGPIRVSVVGEVKNPAAYELVRDRSLTAALAAAGWLTEFADRDRIFVVRREAAFRVRFRAQEITATSPVVARFRLSDGDVVVVE